MISSDSQARSSDERCSLPAGSAAFLPTTEVGASRRDLVKLDTIPPA